MKMPSALCALLGIPYPIIQGAMAWISDADLAAAVSEAGGLGVLAAGNAPAPWVRQQIRRIRTLTQKPFAVNVMLMSPYKEEVIEVIEQEDVKIVITGAGSPGPYMERWKQSGTIVIPVVAATALAKRVARMGADAVIAEGAEGGGHIGEMNTMALIPQVADAVSIPVVAAGGIADARGVLAAFMLGASGAQLGTRFITAYECNAHPAYKGKILQAKDTDTVVSGRSTGHPVRALKNQLTKSFERLERQGAEIEQLDDLGKGALQRAVQEGDVVHGSVMAGQSAGLVRKEQSCQEIVDELVGQCEVLWQSKLQSFQ